MDKRKTYYLTIDTETANTIEDPMMYDLGGAVHDRYGNVEETFSFIIYDVFCADRALFDTAYYAEKRPMYEAQLALGLVVAIHVVGGSNFGKPLGESQSTVKVGLCIVHHISRADYNVGLQLFNST